MDTTTLQNHLTALRARDSELDRRLAELDAKLGAWLAIVQAGHAALLKLARKVVPGAVTRGARTSLVQTAEPSAAQTASDDALLQTLDPETAQAIRVKRRLCRDSRSVQELLEEYRVAQAQEQAQQKSKPAERRGWWRRKDV